MNILWNNNEFSFKMDSNGNRDILQNIRIITLQITNTLIDFDFFFILNRNRHNNEATENRFGFSHYLLNFIIYANDARSFVCYKIQS